MRTIPVSTDVFAAIWADHQAGETNEDHILRRKYGVKAQSPERPYDDAPQGFYDARYGARFPESFEISRVHKGTKYRAHAEGGSWKLLNTGARYPSLKALSDATVGHENAWDGWFYLDADGRRRKVSAMRDPSLIRRRRREVNN